MKKTFLILAALTILIITIGCGGLAYKQEALFGAEFDEPSTNNITALHVEYHTNGAIKSIRYYTTNAVSVTAHDLSNAKLTAFIAKTGAEEMIGDRKGMFDNNSGVTAKGVETEEKLSTVVEKAGDIKKP